MNRSGSSRGISRVVVALSLAGVCALAASPSIAHGQATTPACDSIIAAAKVDDAHSGIFISVQSVGFEMDLDRARRIGITIGNIFTPPRPLKLSVFSGPSIVRGLRIQGADTVTVVRSPTLTGIYRVSRMGRDSVHVVAIRQSLVQSFDSLAIAAIRTASTVEGVFSLRDDSLLFNVALTSDSEPNSQRLFAAAFPRVVMKDATVLPDNPSPKYPASEISEGTSPTVVLRFVVGNDGAVDARTVEAVRAAPTAFLRASLEALAAQRFKPATVNGCPVAQQVDYPFAFMSPSEPGIGAVPPN